MKFVAGNAPVLNPGLYKWSDSKKNSINVNIEKQSYVDIEIAEDNNFW